MEKPRQIAFGVLEQHSHGKDFVEDLLAAELKHNPLSSNNRGLVHELVCGVVRSQRTLDWLIDQKTEGRTQQLVVRLLLRLGLYQLLWLDRVPAHAAVNESVELAKALKLGPLAGFVNAFLRSISSNLDHFRQQLADLESAQPDIRFSHPGWLWRHWETRWGRETAIGLMKWNNQPPVVYARLNTIRTDPAALEAQWRKEGVSFSSRSFPWTEKAMIYELTDHPPISELGTFREGCFYIQDPSTLLAVAALDPKPGETILDQCAAPGGKTAFMAQIMGNRGQIIAQDTHRARLQMIKENCSRLGVTIARALTTTGVSHPELSIAFDRVLVDAPCSNTGVMRRRVDLRWRITAEEIHRLQGVQKDLLSDAALQLKPGGTLVYSTCSLEPEENQGVVQSFLSQNPAFRLSAEQQLTPFQDHVDGAYVAVMTKAF